jgi:transposase
MQSKRDNEGINAIGIMPRYQGVGVHDRWASYDQYDCTHALCNAHLLRDAGSI